MALTRRLRLCDSTAKGLLDIIEKEVTAMRPLLIASVLLMISTSPFGSKTTEAAEKPQNGSKGWAANLWPPFDSWKPFSRDNKRRRSQEPAFVKSTRETFGAAWEGTKRTTKNAWNKTLYLLRPYDKPPKKRQSSIVARREADAGFWSNLFGRKNKQEPMTVNEFLKQPTVY